MFKVIGKLLLILAPLYLSCCYSIPQARNYSGPIPRPYGLEEYYGRDNDILSFAEEIKEQTPDYTVHRYFLTTKHGPITIDFYKRPELSDSVVLVFPVLGGKKNVIENYFSRYFAKHGIDAAIVHRSEEFKKPENFDRLEELNRETVIRDRLALDFFEQALGKKRFGTFGISRGAINVAITAGVDKRLEYNVMAMGGSDIVKVFHNTDQPRVKLTVAKILKERNLTWPELSEYLNRMIKTDPKYLARYIDSKKTLLMLSLFDHTVPIDSGFRLRHEIGDPKTILLMAGHYSAGAYTGFLKLLPPSEELSIFPMDFVESEAMQFYKESFQIGHGSLRLGIMRVLRLPFDLVGRVAHALFERKSKTARTSKTPWDTPLMQASTENMCTVR